MSDPTPDPWTTTGTPDVSGEPPTIEHVVEDPEVARQLEADGAKVVHLDGNWVVTLTLPDGTESVFTADSVRSTAEAQKLAEAPPPGAPAVGPPSQAPDQGPAPAIVGTFTTYDQGNRNTAAPTTDVAAPMDEAGSATPRADTAPEATQPVEGAVSAPTAEQAAALTKIAAKVNGPASISQGDIVLFVLDRDTLDTLARDGQPITALADNDVYPAIVTRVISADVVNLRVLVDSAAYLPFISQARRIDPPENVTHDHTRRWFPR